MNNTVLVITGSVAGYSSAKYIELRQVRAYVRNGWRVAQRDAAERAAYAEALRIQER